jgi:hypothetical protein
VDQDSLGRFSFSTKIFESKPFGNKQNLQDPIFIDMLGHQISSSGFRSTSQCCGCPEEIQCDCFHQRTGFASTPGSEKNTDSGNAFANMGLFKRDSFMFGQNQDQQLIRGYSEVKRVRTKENKQIFNQEISPVQNKILSNNLKNQLQVISELTSQLNLLKSK